MCLRIHEGTALGGGAADFAVDLEFGFDVAGGAVEAVDPQGGLDEFVFKVETLFVVDVCVDDHKAYVHVFEFVDREVGVEEFEAQVFKPVDVHGVVDMTDIVNVIGFDADFELAVEWSHVGSHVLSMFWVKEIAALHCVTLAMTLKRVSLRGVEDDVAIS